MQQVYAKIRDDAYRDGIGNTPVATIKIGSSFIYAKEEWLNRFGSIKDRAAYFLIKSMEISGKIDGRTIVEGTSGNTGIAVAGISSALGIKSEIILPSNASDPGSWPADTGKYSRFSRMTARNMLIYSTGME